MEKNESYKGFEQGPIRPPSESGSLLIRVTRNCPWNRCTFCGLYKDTKFSLRPVSHVLKDIGLINKFVERIKNGDTKYSSTGQGEDMAFYAAFTWVLNGMNPYFCRIPMWVSTAGSFASSVAFQDDCLTAKYRFEKFHGSVRQP